MIGISFCILGLESNVYGEVVLSPQTRIAKTRFARNAVSGFTKSNPEEKQIGIYLEVKSDSVINEIRKAGFEPVQHKEHILTLRCSLSDIDVLLTIPGIIRIQLAGKPLPRLYRTTQEVGATAAYNGVGDPKTYYNGEGVVVGVLDFGFDLTHPAFFDASAICRIVRLWDQSISGTPPTGYTYGAEYATSTAIAQKKHTSDEYHGTHVLGIAAGKGIGTDMKFQGIAPKSEIVLVELGERETDLCDAIKYVFDYAASVDRPAVINLSLGTHMGPHDGTSCMDKMIDSYSGAGKIIVGAAGNEGYLPMHLSKVFTTREKINTVIDFYEDGNAEKMNYVDIWTKKYPEYFNWSISIYDTTGTKLGQSDVHSSSVWRTSDQIVIGSDSIYVDSESEKVVSNRRTNLFLAIENPRMNEYLTVLEIEATNDTIHMWNLAYDQSGMSFSTFPKLSNLNWVNGDINYTVGEIGGTAKRIISVGAVLPVQGARAYFSSIGPSRDGRIKPEIMAPGYGIAAPLNSFASDLPDSYFSTPFNGRNYSYGKLSGTSMAAPHVTGGVALFLQKDKTLTPEAVKIQLATSAATTGQMGTLPNNTWGNGMLRVLAYLQTASPIIELSQFSVYPNPSQGFFHVKGPSGMVYTVEVYSMQGHKIYQSEGMETSSHQISCVAGHYAVIIRMGKHVESHMLLIGKPK
jgi:subtilisin family serine protease